MHSAGSLFINPLELKDTTLPIKKTPDQLKNEISLLNKEIKKKNAELDVLIKEKEHLMNLLDEYHCESIVPLKLETPRDVYGEDKVKLILDIFSPRTDIFATRQKRKDNGKFVYYPKCANIWKDGCFRKTREKTPCQKCPMNEKENLSTLAIWKGTFENKDPEGIGAIGIYPLKSDNTTRFVAIDLDEKDWKKSAESLLITARNYGIAMVAEKSFSGNGIHLWILFKEDIPAADARKLAFLIIDKARENNSRIAIDSYDRLFPSQDKLTDKGYGNLILLPLVGSAAERGCTVFLNDDMEPYPMKEQLRFLSSVHKHTKEEIKLFIKELSAGNLELKNDVLSNDTLNPEWSRWIPKLSNDDILSPLIMYRSSGLSFDKLALSGKAQEALRRASTISNPEYYKRLAKADGRHPSDIPSRIPLYEENNRVIKLPRGLYSMIANMLTEQNIAFKEEDHRTQGTNLDIESDLKLLGYQKKAVEAAMKTDYGIIASATSSGKTAIAIAIMAERKERTLILVNSVNLMEQWKESLDKSLIIHAEPISKRRGIIGTAGGSRKDKLSMLIDIATLQSLPAILKKKGYSFASNYGMVIVDECHHIGAGGFRLSLAAMNAKYVYGLTATPKRGDGLQKIEYAECGSIIFRFDAAELAYSRGIVQYFVPSFLNTSITSDSKNMLFSELIDVLSSDTYRNNVIADDISRSYHEGRKIIVFTRRIEQNNAISNILKEKDIPTIVLDGTMDRKEAKRILSELRSETVNSVLIATDKFLGEGIDIPSLDTMFLASPFMKETVIKQCAGRLARVSEGKTTTWIHDYVDFKIPRLNYMYIKRLRIYKDLGYIPSSNTAIPKDEMLFNPASFDTALIKDISEARKTIILSSSYIASSTISKNIIARLNEKSKSGLSILIRTSRKAKETKGFQVLISLLTESIMIEISENTKNYMIIDKTICWYGDLSILGQSTKTRNDNKSILRIVDSEVSECFESAELL